MYPKNGSDTAAPGGDSDAAALKGVSNGNVSKNVFDKAVPTLDVSDEGVPDDFKEGVLKVNSDEAATRLGNDAAGD